MRALTLTPMVADSLAVSDVPDPRPGPADLLVDGLAVGVCGTDRELAQGLYGWAPPQAGAARHRPRVPRPTPRQSNCHPVPLAIWFQNTRWVRPLPSRNGCR